MLCHEHFVHKTPAPRPSKEHNAYLQRVSLDHKPHKKVCKNNVLLDYPNETMMHIFQRMPQEVLIRLHLTEVWEKKQATRTTLAAL